MDERSLEITSGNAAKIAADLLTSVYNQTDLLAHGEDTVVEAWSGLHLKIAQRLVDNSAQIVAGNVIATAFPGTNPTPVQEVQQGSPFPALNPQVAPPAIVAPPAAPSAPVSAVVAPQNVIPFPQAQPAPIPGAAGPAGGGDPKIDEAVAQLVQDINAGTAQQNWEDNRAVKAADCSKKFPDFKHKTWKRPGDRYFVGIYLNDKKMSPEAAAQLRAVGL